MCGITKVTYIFLKVSRKFKIFEQQNKVEYYIDKNTTYAGSEWLKNEVYTVVKPLMIETISVLVQIFLKMRIHQLACNRCHHFDKKPFALLAFQNSALNMFVVFVVLTEKSVQS